MLAQLWSTGSIHLGSCRYQNYTGRGGDAVRILRVLSFSLGLSRTEHSQSPWLNSEGHDSLYTSILYEVFHTEYGVLTAEYRIYKQYAQKQISMVQTVKENN